MGKNEDSILLSEKGERYYHKKKKTNYILTACLICAWCCFFGLVILVVGGAITTYLLWPRIPEAEITDVKTRSFDINPLSLPLPSVYLNFTFNVALDNENYFEIDVSDVDLELIYQGAVMGNITQLPQAQVRTLESRTANQVCKNLN